MHPRSLSHQEGLKASAPRVPLVHTLTQDQAGAIKGNNKDGLVSSQMCRGILVLPPPQPLPMAVPWQLVPDLRPCLSPGHLNGGV